MSNNIKINNIEEYLMISKSRTQESAELLGGSYK